MSPQKSAKKRKKNTARKAANLDGIHLDGLFSAWTRDGLLQSAGCHNLERHQTMVFAAAYDDRRKQAILCQRQNAKRRRIRHPVISKESADHGEQLRLSGQTRIL